MSASGAGVTVERRGLLGLAAGLAAAGLARGRWPTARTAGEAQTLEEFLATANPALRALLAEAGTPEGELAYLHTLAACAARLGEVPLPATLRETAQGEGVGIGAHPGGDPFVVLHWRMEPGAVIRTHPHTHGHVVTVPLGGSVRVRNWEVVGEPDFDTPEAFRVRLTTDAILTPGSGVNLVPLHRGYCHGFEAGPDGAHGLDLTTRVREKRSTPYLRIVGEPLDAWGRVYEGRWEG